MDRPKTAVVGIGRWGPNIVRNLTNMDDCQLEVLVDRDEKRLKSLCRLYPGLSYHQNVDRIMKHIDAVFIATPASTHYHVAKKTLNAGLDTFIEKPLAMNYDQALELVTIAKEKKLILMVGHILLYHPAIIRLRWEIESGNLGDIYYLNAIRVNLGTIKTDENALWSLAPHDISAVLFLLDEKPNAVTATGDCYLNKDRLDIAFITLYFKSGKIAHIHTSWLDPHKKRQLTIVGSKKMASFDDMEAQEKLRIYDKGVDRIEVDSSPLSALSLRFGDISIPKLPPVEPLRAECQAFIEAVRSRESPKSDGEFGALVVRIIEAAEASIAEGKRISL